MSRILALHNSHNASMCEINDGKIIYYQEAERIIRIKKTDYWKILIEKYQNENFDSIIFVYSFRFKPKSDVDVLKKLLKKRNIKYKNLIIEKGKHHFFHACSSYFNSGLEESYALVADGNGSVTEENDEEIVSLYYFKKNKFKKIFKLWASKDDKVIGKDIYINTLSLGKLFEYLKTDLKLKEPGSIMALSSYAQFEIKKHVFFKEKLKHFQFISQMAFEKNFSNAFSLSIYAQQELEKIILNYVKNIIKNKNRNLCVSGGIFMNTVLNSKILDICPNLYVDPFSDDSGLSMGAAQWYSNKNKFFKKKIESLFLGDSANYTGLSKKNKYNIVPKEVAKLISEKNIIGIFQGRNEMGKRALGNRSFLFDPRDPSAKEKINLIKEREWFRPSAGTILHDKINEWFDTKSKKETPYMSYVFKVKKNNIPGITHVDNTCRIQTVTKNQNFHFYNLINEFYKITGVPILGNTSLNLAGQPLVNEIKNIKKLHKEHFIALKFEYIYFPELNKMYNLDYFIENFV